MSPTPGRAKKVAVGTAAAALAWVTGATIFCRSGGINPAGLLPTAGCFALSQAGGTTDHG